MNFKSTLTNKAKSLPQSSGCYIYRDKAKSVLYIGKAINLRKRVSSYFANFDRLDPKIKIMVEQINEISFVTTDSELEALILETNLIKNYSPKYNRLMKDDKNYAWLMVTTQEDYPRIQIIRDKKIKSAEYFGPYTDISPIKRILKNLRRLFPYRTCFREIYFFTNNNGEKQIHSSNKIPCLYYHLKLCDAPCTGNISRQKYRENIVMIKRFFKSQKTKIAQELERKMLFFAQKQLFEKATLIRNKLNDLSYISQYIQISDDTNERMVEKTKEEKTKAALLQLIEKLHCKNKFHKDFRIECYDISNTSGKQATGSMIVFTNGRPDKSMYRKFKIKTKEFPDDFLMLKEVFSRRFTQSTKALDESFSKIPDMIIVDGGKGQLSSVLTILKGYNKDIPTYGLAKKHEELFQLSNNTLKKIVLRRSSPELFLIQKVRDEAHRFALKYHRLLRSKKHIHSLLDDVPGVGKIIRKRLLQAFGSTENIKKASISKLQTVIKNKRTAENIKKLL
jgi:excinuclease ABC subunit C